ncbi:aldose 1-epimerase [Flaviramulus aquimarinus]|uniref:Aldose 1-epimerase n=1 Tax=Flaviramulus aquimarinus TaxID=1170456 RepID=A0ABP9EY19_9FLAO
MFSITQNKDLNFLAIENPKKKLYAKISLNDGASLQSLTLKGHTLIEDLTPLKYNSSYASSILFPFANRIKDGTYPFEDKVYQLEKNQEEENNAIHGLVYNKTFQVIEKVIYKDFASIKLEYNETSNSIGFPYTYKIQLEYIFSDIDFSLNVSVKNTSSKAFPFTIGWHPYFLSDNLYNSSLNFISSQKIIIGDRNITTGIENIELINTFEIKDKQLDDCWILDSNNITFITPKYQLLISSSVKNNFLQLYTPPKSNTIAIEPTTGVSDSFNNKIGLKVLNANDIYNLTWNLKIK